MAVSIERKKQLIKEVKAVMGINFRYYFKKMPYSAEVDVKSARIGFAKEKNQPWQDDNEEEFIGDILHELAHIWAYRNGKFRAYHNEPRTRAQKIAHLATAYRAEMWVDRKAREWARDYFGIKYKLFYTKRADDKKWFEDNYKKECRANWGWD